MRSEAGPQGISVLQWWTGLNEAGIQASQRSLAPPKSHAPTMPHDSAGTRNVGTGLPFPQLLTKLATSGPPDTISHL